MTDTQKNHNQPKAAKSKKTCCIHQEESATKVVSKKVIKSDQKNDHHHADDNGKDHSFAIDRVNIFKMFVPAIISLIMLLVGIVMDNIFGHTWFTNSIRVTWYLIAYAPVALPVLKDAIESVAKGQIFSEFFLMTIATIGAFIINQYPEGVAVMLFYTIGEVFQTMAVSKAKLNIKTLLDQRPDQVTVLKNNELRRVKAETVSIGEIIQLRPGEKLALDAELLSETASFNTAALTGESKPDTKRKGQTVLAGMINLNTVSQVKVTTAYTDSKLSKILDLVQNALSQKAPTELFIRKFAKIYTPIVVFLAIAICLLPYFFLENYDFRDWLYRALVFLVISCPCALVISIPLGYFGGIGAASKNGILFKGSNFLDTLSRVQNVVVDKTGTLTKGIFEVQEIVFDPVYDKNEILQMVNKLESYSTHPVATAIHKYVGRPKEQIILQQIQEIAGHGLKSTINGKNLLVGNFKLMDLFEIPYHIDPNSIVYTTIAIAYNNKFVGYITIADSIKEDAQQTITQLAKLNVKVTMLSGDKTTVVKYVAEQLGIDNAFGDLLPEDKVNKLKTLKNETVAFVGDGVNDAPALALSDVGIAMGGLGSDAAIQSADVVIQDDKPSKIPIAILIGRKTKQIVWQNISLAFGVKAIVLILGAGGLATMWEAVFADVGVALLAILNAVRIQRMKF